MSYTYSAPPRLSLYYNLSIWPVRNGFDVFGSLPDTSGVPSQCLQSAARLFSFFSSSHSPHGYSDHCRPESTHNRRHNCHASPSAHVCLASNSSRSLAERASELTSHQHFARLTSRTGLTDSFLHRRRSPPLVHIFVSHNIRSRMHPIAPFHRAQLGTRSAGSERAKRREIRSSLALGLFILHLPSSTDAETCVLHRKPTSIPMICVVPTKPTR